MKDGVKQEILRYKNLLQQNKVDEFFRNVGRRASVADALLSETSAPILNYMTEIPPYFLDNGCRVKDLLIPGNIKIISGRAFYDSNLRSVKMESGVKTIEAQCFEGCKSLEVVDLSDTIENIPSEAFADCINLKRLFLPDSIKTIGNNAFKNCDDIEIVANFRVKDKIKARKSDLEFLKKHLKFTH